MKKRLIVLLTILLSAFIFTNESLAKTVSVVFEPKNANHALNADYGHWNVAHTYLTFTDSSKAYCVNPGYTTPKKGDTCNPTPTDEKLKNAVRTIINEKKDDATTSLAIKIVSIAINGDGEASTDNGTRCAYVAAAASAAKKAGYTAKASNEKVAGTKKKCSDINITGAEIDLAAKGLKGANTAANNNNGSTGTVTATVNNTQVGKATVIVKNTTKSDATLKLNCDANAKSAACNTTTTIPAGQTKTIVVEGTAVNGGGAGQCGSFSGEITYKTDSTGKAGECTEVTKYSCGNNSHQSFMGCSAYADGNGNGNGQGNANGTVTTPISQDGKTTINIKCPEKTKNCTTPEPTPIIKTKGDGDGVAMCDSEGDTIISIKEASQYASNDSVENCVLGNKDFEVKAINNYCATYCVEDYEFYAPGMDFSDGATFKDGKWLLTSGSYFKLKDDGKDTGNIVCYTEIDMNSFEDSVLLAANGYATKLSTREVTCDSKTDDNGVTTYYEHIKETKYTAAYTGADHKTIAITGTPTETTNVLATNTCQAGITQVSDAERATALADYKTTVNNAVKQLKECYSASSEYADYICEEPRLVEFKYGFNESKYTIEGTTTKTKDTTELFKCTNGYCENKASEADTSITLNGIGGSVTSDTFKDVSHVKKNVSLETKYDFSGIGICNNYNTGESQVGVTEEECKAKEGTTYIKGWPISYETPQGNYEYEINVSNYGYVSKAGSCGGRLEEKYAKNKKASFGCRYQVNGCGNCKFYCDPDDNCEIPDCDQNCIFNCQGVGCIYNNGKGLAINYQPISTINTDSWFAYMAGKYDGATMVAANMPKPENATAKPVAETETKSVGSINWTTPKGIMTKDAIADKGESIYDEDAEYVVVLTPEAIRDIKNDNQEKLSDGGYVNKSLKCKNQENADYIVCKSEYLDVLVERGVVISRNETFEGYNGDYARKSGTGPAWK